MTGQDNVWNRSRDVRIRELSRHRLHLRSVVARRWRWEWGRALDLRRVVFQPLAVVEGDRRNDATSAAVGGGETPFPDRTLGEDDLVAFFVQRDGGYRGYGAQNAPVRLAAQHAVRPGR